MDMPDTKRISLLIVGRAGAGKTALGNAILGEEIGKETTDLSSDNDGRFEEYSVNRLGVDIVIYDSPGLQGSSSTQNATFWSQLKEKVDQCDVVIYCMRMDAVRLEKMDIENINLISRNLGAEVWGKTVVALTFGNLVTCPPSYRNDEASEERWFRKRAADWQTQLRENLYQASIPEDIADRISLVPVGYNKPTLYFPNPWAILCDKNWLFSFLYTVNISVGTDALAAVLEDLKTRMPPDDTPRGGDPSCWEMLLNLVAERRKLATAFGAGIGATIGACIGALVGATVDYYYQNRDVTRDAARIGGIIGATIGAVVVYKLPPANGNDMTQGGLSNV